MAREEMEERGMPVRVRPVLGLPREERSILQGPETSESLLGSRENLGLGVDPLDSMQSSLGVGGLPDIALGQSRLTGGLERELPSFGSTDHLMSSYSDQMPDLGLGSPLERQKRVPGLSGQGGFAFFANEQGQVVKVPRAEIPDGVSAINHDGQQFRMIDESMLAQQMPNDGIGLETPRRESSPRMDSPPIGELLRERPGPDLGLGNGPDLENFAYFLDRKNGRMAQVPRGEVPEHINEFDHEGVHYERAPDDVIRQVHAMQQRPPGGRVEVSERPVDPQIPLPQQQVQTPPTRGRIPFDDRKRMDQERVPDEMPDGVDPREEMRRRMMPPGSNLDDRMQQPDPLGIDRDKVQQLANQFNAPLHKMYHALAAEQMKAGRPDAAVMLLDKAKEQYFEKRDELPLAEEKEDPFLMHMAQAYEQIGAKQQALDCIEEQYRGSRDPQVLAKKGELLYDLGKKDEAAQAMIDALPNLPRGDKECYDIRQKLDEVLEPSDNRRSQLERFKINDYDSAFKKLDTELKTSYRGFAVDVTDGFAFGISLIYGKYSFRNIKTIEKSKIVVEEFLYGFLSYTSKNGHDKRLEGKSDSEIKGAAKNIVENLSISDEKLTRMFATGNGMGLLMGLYQSLKEQYEKQTIGDVMAKHVCSEDSEEVKGFAKAYLVDRKEEVTDERVAIVGENLADKILKDLLN